MDSWSQYIFWLFLDIFKNASIDYWFVYFFSRFFVLFINLLFFIHIEMLIQMVLFEKAPNTAKIIIICQEITLNVWFIVNTQEISDVEKIMIRN